MAAANKFATRLHKNTNKLTLILVYVLLEWILILLLLLNSLFSYLLIQYADFFGLKRPCVLCSRLDHVFDSSKSYRDLVCDDHASEISKLGYCSNHQKLAESEDMCEDCSRTGKSFAFFPWMKQIGVVDGLKNENGDVGLDCSCCGVELCSKSCLLVKPSWGILDCKLNIARGEDDFHDDDRSRSGFAEQKIEKEESESDDDDLKVSIDKSIDVHAQQQMEFYIDEEEDCYLVPIEDSAAKKLDDEENFGDEEEDCHLVPIEDSATKKLDDEGNFGGEEDFVMDFDKLVDIVDELFVKSPALATIHEGEEEDAKSGELELIEEVSNSITAAAAGGDLISFDAHEDAEEEFLEMQSDDIEAEEDVLEMQSDEIEAEEDVLEMQSDEIEAEVSIGPEIPDHEPIDDVDEDYSANLHVQHDDGAKQLDNNKFVEFRTLSVDTNELVVMNKHLVFCSELNEIEEDKIPDTPTYMDSPDYSLYKRIFPFERKEFGTEDYSDGSVMSDSTDGVITMEKLKTALRTERKTLNDLFAELEEERSASAVAANETMTMINRLQEEKAAMQMEALQYQRMMEEQSEYDQEALQLLNELMSKRERENAEQLEMYRKKVAEYESRGRMTAMRKNGSMKSRTSSVSCSITADDSDEVSVDLNPDVKEEDCSENQNTPIDLDESLASFENERVSILEQLKVLEEKLVILSEEEEQHFDYSYTENGDDHNGDFDHSSEENMFKEMNGKHHHDRKFLQKSLLPLFDATEAESVNGVIPNGNGQVYDSATLQNDNSGVTKFPLENRKHAMEEEVEHVYDRLQALEADREFLKHCISSLRKGDKGVYLLQEILQHLRDLRSIELCTNGSL